MEAECDRLKGRPCCGNLVVGIRSIVAECAGVVDIDIHVSILQDALSRVVVLSVRPRLRQLGPRIPRRADSVSNRHSD